MCVNLTTKSTEWYTEGTKNLCELCEKNFVNSVVKQKLNSIVAVQVCDATEAAQGFAAGNKIKILNE